MRERAIKTARYVQKSYYEVTLSAREGVNLDLVIEKVKRRYRHVIVIERRSMTYQVVEFFGTFHKLQKLIEELEKEEVWAGFEVRYPKM